MFGEIKMFKMPQRSISRIPQLREGQWRGTRGNATITNGQWRRLHGTRGGTCPHFYKWLGTGGTVNKTEQTVLTITKALTKTTNCTFRAKKWSALPKTTKKFFFGAIGAPHFGSGPVPPTLSNSFRRHCEWRNGRQLTDCELACRQDVQ